MGEACPVRGHTFVVSPEQSLRKWIQFQVRKHYIYGSILQGQEFSAYLCLYFVGEKSTPVSIIWVHIKFQKIGWIDNYLYIIENKYQIFLKNLENWIIFLNFQIIFLNFQIIWKIWKIYSNFQIFQKNLKFVFNNVQVIIYPTYFSKLYLDPNTKNGGKNKIDTWPTRLCLVIAQGILRPISKASTRPPVVPPIRATP